MQTIRLVTHVGQDGLLQVELPSELSDQELDVLLVIQPIGARHSAAVNAKREWPAGFFDATFGSLRDDTLACEPQGDYKARDEIG